MKIHFGCIVLAFLIFIGRAHTKDRVFSVVGRDSLWNARQGILLTKNNSRAEQDVIVDFRFPYKTIVNVQLKIQRNVSRSVQIRHDGAKSSTQIFIPAVDRTTEVKLGISTDRFEETKTVTVEPIKPFEIFLVMHTHTDLGYTQPQNELVDLHMDFIDQAVSYAKATKDRPDRERFRWTCESMWAVQNYLDNRPRDKIQEFIDQVKDGNIEVTALYLNQAALSDYDGMTRHVADAIRMSRDYGIPVRSAMNTDVNGISWGYVPILSSVGVQNLNMAVNWTKGGPPFRDQCPNGFFWKAPDGSRLLVWNSDGYQTGNQLGFIPINESTPQQVSDKYSRLIERGYPFDFISVQIQGIGGDNRPPNIGICDAVREWNNRFQSPRLRTATVSDFFNKVWEGSDKIPEYCGDWPDWWSDGLASTAIETGLSRRAQVLLQAAGALASVGPDSDGITVETDRLFKQDILFNEHTWGGHNSIDEPWAPYHKMIWNWKAGHVYRAWHGALKLGQQLLEKYASGQEAEILVFNPFTEPFKGPVQVWVYRRGRTALKSDFQVVDEKAQVVPARYIPGSDWGSLILDLDIEPLSIRRLSVVPGKKGPVLQSTIKVDHRSISSAFYRIAWDSDGLVSWYDLQSQRELLDEQSSFRLGNIIHEVLPNPDGGRSGRMVLENRDGKPLFHRRQMRLDSIKVLPVENVSRTVRLYGQLPGFTHATTDVRLYDFYPRVDVVVALEKTMNYDPEAIYVPFPVKMENPDVYLDLPGFVGRPWKQQLTNTCEDYFAVEDWVAVGNANGGVIIASEEAPLFQFDKIRTGDWNRSGAPGSGLVLSWPMNTYWYTNFAAYQEPHQEFRYYLTNYRGAFDASQAERFSRQTIRRPLAFFYPDSEKGNRQIPISSFLRVEPDNLLIESITPSRGADEIFVRVREMVGKPTRGRIILDTKKSQADRAFLDGRLPDGPEKNNEALVFHIHAHETKTLKVEK